MHPKVNVLILFNICLKSAVLKEKKFKFDHSFVFSCLHLLFPQNNYIQNLSKQYFPTMGPCLFLPKHLFCLPRHKTQWTMLVDSARLKICLLGTSNFMVTLTFFPWCKLKWCHDEFNSQLEILQGLGTTSWSMV